ncbi:MAG: YncE family protein [Acetobacteraceae bacterium]|nr:YncE family protein [Acetobacteraceae bacterium]
MKRRLSWTTALTALLLSGMPLGARADLLVSANDGKAVLINGVNTVPDKPVPDTVSIIDLTATPPKVKAEIQMPTSLVGPPSSVAIARDESYALVTAATKIDPADKKKVVPHNIVSVVDLQASPPKVIATHETGAGASGVAINRAGTLALVANRVEGTVSVFTIAGKTLTPAGKVDLGNPKSEPSAVAFTPDGKRALVTRTGDSKITLLTVDGTKVTLSGRDIYAGHKPYPVGIAPNGSFAVVTNVGMGGGDADTMSLIDMTANPPRTVDTVTVGPSPESMTIAPDGKHIAVTLINGTNKPGDSPFFKVRGAMPVFEVRNMKLVKVTEAQIGRWCQGAGWNKSSTLILVQCMVEQEIEMFKFDGKTLKPAGVIKINGGPAGIATTPQ